MSEGKLIVKNAKGVIFDLDGTLVDSMNVWKEIDVSYLGKHGMMCQMIFMTKLKE